MAKKVIVQTIDDLDGESVADETIEFALDGVGYEIDLSSANAKKLRDELEAWAKHARRVSGRRRQPKTPAPRAKSADNREQTAAIREWARNNGFEVSARGRIPAEVQQAYRAANSDPED
ncbi:histone-like nucleoid-structuring protein Lsr2 [Nocardia jiangsuensis]|uniref:Lsr2 family protein n=1 Tax=Nocardia jiangsuensis TaxID=1691563 RepID=A0ABV8DY82_9NOCA